MHQQKLSLLMTYIKVFQFVSYMVVTDVTSTLRTYGVAFLASLISHNQLAIVSLVALELAC